MPFTPLLGTAAMVVAVATGPIDPSVHVANLSKQEKIAATEPAIRSATDCITHAVARNPRYQREPELLGELIVASMPSCVTPVRTMISTFDRYYGEGTGQAFFMGPYLDVLPKAVIDSSAKEQ